MKGIDVANKLNMLKKFFPTNIESLHVGKLIEANILLEALDIDIQKHKTINSRIDLL